MHLGLGFGWIEGVALLQRILIYVVALERFTRPSFKLDHADFT